MRLLYLGIIAPPPQQGKDGCLVGQTVEGRALRFRTADTDRKATQRIDDDKAVLVGHIVADEDGPAAGEGRLLHEGGYGGESGRASWRERGCQDGIIQVVDVSLKKTTR